MIYLPESDSEDELPPEWEEKVTDHGFIYYANNETRSTQWNHPRTGKRKKVSGHLPFGWEKVITEDGKTVFTDHRRGKTSYTDPRLAFASEIKEGKNFESNFRQRFDASTSALQILHGLDLSQKIIVITGGNSGIGYETARTFLHHGGVVIIACRNLSSGAKAAEALRIRENVEESRCIALECDLSSLESVDSFVLRFRSLFDRLDILVLNAGVFGILHEITIDGFERTFQTNFLSHLYMSYSMRRVLITASSPKIILVSSESHRFAALANTSPKDWDWNTFSVNYANEYFSVDSYNNSKFLLMAVGLEMDRRWRKMGIRSIVVHPGNCVSSNFSRNWWVYRLIFFLARPFSKSLQQAAASTVFAAAATEMEEVGGIYINNCFPCNPHQSATSYEVMNRAWDISFDMIKNVVGKNKLDNL